MCGERTRNRRWRNWKTDEFPEDKKDVAMVTEWREEHSRARVQQVQGTCGGGQAWCVGVEQGASVAGVE